MCDRLSRGVYRLMAVAAVMLLCAQQVLACPSCKDAIESDPVAAALSWTTLLLIGVPMALFGSLGGWVAYVYWRAAHPAATVLGRAANFWRPSWTEKESET